MKKVLSVLIATLLIFSSVVGAFTATAESAKEYLCLKQGTDFTFTHFASNGFAPITEDGVQTGLSYNPANATFASTGDYRNSFATFGFTDSTMFSSLMGKTLRLSMDITVSSQMYNGQGEQPSMTLSLIGSADRSGIFWKEKAWLGDMYNVAWNDVGVTKRISFVFTPTATTDFNWLNLRYNGVGTFTLTNITLAEFVDSVSAVSSDEAKGTASVTMPTYSATAGTAPADKFTAGETAIFTATPNEGYTFKNWTDEEGNVVSVDSTYKAAIVGDKVLTANFIAATKNYLCLKQGTDFTFTHFASKGFSPITENGVQAGLSYNPENATFASTGDYRNSFATFGFTDSTMFSSLMGKTLRLSMDITVSSQKYNGQEEQPSMTLSLVGSADRSGIFWKEKAWMGDMYNVAWNDVGVTKRISFVFTPTATTDFNWLNIRYNGVGTFTLTNITLAEFVDNVSAVSANDEMGSAVVAPKAHSATVGTLPEGKSTKGEISTFTAIPNEGYTFKNWTDEDGDVVSTDAVYDAPITRDITLTANFEVMVTSTLSFDSFGGSSVESISAEVGKSVNLPTPTKAGCYFEGWYTDKGLIEKFGGIVPENDITLYAKWGKGMLQSFEDSSTVAKTDYLTLNSNPEGGAYSGNTVLEFDLENCDGNLANSKNRIIINKSGAISKTSAFGTDGVFEISFKYKATEGSFKLSVNTFGGTGVWGAVNGWYSSFTLNSSDEWQTATATIVLGNSGSNTTEDYISLWIGQADATVTKGKLYIDDVAVNPVNQNLATAYNGVAALRSKNASSTGKNGLRIYNEIKKDWIANNNIVEFGVVAIRTEGLNGAELTVQTEGAKKGVAFSDNVSKLWQDTDTSYIYTAYLTNIKDEYFGKDYSIKTYALDADGNYYYGSVCEISIYLVANSMDNGNTANGGAVSEDDKAAFKTFVDGDNLAAYAQWCDDYSKVTGDIYYGIITENGVTDADMTAKTFDLSNEDLVSSKIKTNGRTLVDDNGITAEWTCSGFTFAGVFSENVTLDVTASATLHCFAIIDDDVENATRIVVEAGDSTIILASSMTKEYHKITFEKTTDTGSFVTAKALNYTGVLANKPAAKELSIEFIGDSVTSATSLYSAAEQPDELLRNDTRLGFASLVARGLDADLSVVSRSGHSIVDHLANDRISIMNWYNSTLYTNKDAAWNGSSDIVVVALGTNDTPFYLDSNGEYYDPNGELEAGVKSLLTTVRAANPNAHIIFTYGMMDLRIADTYKEFVNEWKSENSDDNTYYLGLTRGEYCVGEGGHPNVAGHAHNANVILNFIKNNNLS